MDHKKEFRSKVLIFYDALFFKDDDFLMNSAHFWGEFFLLWANRPKLEQIIVDFSGQQLLKSKNLLNMLSNKCISVIRIESGIKSVNAIQTLMAIIKGITNKNGIGFDTMDVLFGFEDAELLIKDLSDGLCRLLLNSRSEILTKIAFDSLLSLVTLTCRLDENAFFDYFLNDDAVFDAVVRLLSDPENRRHHGDGAVLLLTLLVNYRKHDDMNAYIGKLSILDDQLALNGLSHVIALSLARHNESFRDNFQDSVGLLASVSQVVGSAFVDDCTSVVDCVKCDDRLLLAMYEAVHLNRNFITTLASLPAHPLICESLSNTRNNSQNLFATFITYCSVIMQELKSDRTRNATKLCFIILTCISEDQYANGLMHDINMTFRIPLYRPPMRHRKGTFHNDRLAHPLVVSVLDLLCEFITSHLMRQFPSELYFWTLGIIHRLICYQKKFHVRLLYDWRRLWNALISLLRYLERNESYLMANFDIFLLCNKVFVILNLFITFGDTFLSNTVAYDHLYYEIIRQRDTFDHLHALVQRYLNESTVVNDSASKLANQLINVRAIIGNLQAKIEKLDRGSLTEEKILHIVRNSYHSLTLKLYEHLDIIDRYIETPNQCEFFESLVRVIVTETRNGQKDCNLDQNAVLRDLATIL